MDYSVTTKILLCVILILPLTCLSQTLGTLTVDDSSGSASTPQLEAKTSTTVALEASVTQGQDHAYSTMSSSQIFEGISTADHSQNAASEELFTDTTTNGISEMLSDGMVLSPSSSLDTSSETASLVIGETVTHVPLVGESSTLTTDISAGEIRSLVPQVSSSQVADKMENTALSETVQPSSTMSIVSSQPLPTVGDIIETIVSMTDLSSSDVYSELITVTDLKSSFTIFESTSEITPTIESDKTDALKDMSMNSMIQTVSIASPKLDSEATSEIPTLTEISNFTLELSSTDIFIVASESPMISDSSPSITDFPEPSSTGVFTQSSMTIEPSRDSTHLPDLSTITTFPMTDSSMTVSSVPQSFSSNDFSEFSVNIESSEVSTNGVCSDVSSTTEQLSSFTTIPDVSSLSEVLSESSAMSIEFVNSMTSSELQSLITVEALSESSIVEISEIVGTVTMSIQATESVAMSDSLMSSVVHDLSVSLLSSMSSSGVILLTTAVTMTATTTLSTDSSVMATEIVTVVTTLDSSQSVVPSTSMLETPIASVIAPTKTSSVPSPSTPIPSDTTASTATGSPSTGGLSTGGKVAIGILVPLGIFGLVIGGVILYKRYNMTHRSLKAYFNSSIRYRTYTNASFKDDEVALEGTWRSLSNP